jgi:hypothetical protein
MGQKRMKAALTGLTGLGGGLFFGFMSHPRAKPIWCSPRQAGESNPMQTLRVAVNQRFSLEMHRTL